ncbi:hypothetical protein ACTFIW_013130 [Dictyostelium discoideum]
MESIICNSCFEVYDEAYYLSPCGDTICKKCLSPNISTLVSSIGVVNSCGGGGGAAGSSNGTGTGNGNGNSNGTGNSTTTTIDYCNQITCKICDKKVNSYYINKEIQILLDSLKVKSCPKHHRKETQFYCLDCKSTCCSNCKSDKVHKSHQISDYNLILFNSIYYNIEKQIMNKNKNPINNNNPNNKLTQLSNSTNNNNNNNNFNSIKNNVSIKFKDQRVRLHHTFFNNCKEIIQNVNVIKNKIKDLIPKNGVYCKRTFYLKSIELNKNSAISYFNLAITLIDSTEQSVTLFDNSVLKEDDLYLRSLSIDPNNPFCYFNLAIGLGSSSSSPTATTTTTTTTTTNNTNTNSPQQQIIIENGASPPIISPSTSQSSSLINTENEAQTSTILLPNGKKVNKVGLLIKAIEVDSNYSYAYYNLGKCLKTSSVVFSNSTIMKKKDLFIKYISFHPNHAFAYNNLAINIKPEETVTLLNSGKIMTQSELYKKAIDLNPFYSNPYINLASIICGNEEPVKLLNGQLISKKELLIKAIDIDPLNANAYNNLATNIEKDEIVTLASGKQVNKKYLYLKSIDCNPNNANAYNNLALFLKTNEDKIQLLNGIWLDKKSLYIRSLSIEPLNNLMAYNNLANCLKPNEKIQLLNGNWIDKKTLYIKSISIDPTIPRIFINLAKNMNFIEKIQLEDGTKLLKKDILIKIVDFEPKQWIHYYNLANSLKLNESVKLQSMPLISKISKKELYLKALDLNPNSDARLYNVLAGIIKPNETVKLLNDKVIYTKKDLFLKSIQLEKDNPNTYLNLSLILLHNESVTMLNELNENSLKLNNTPTSTSNTTTTTTTNTTSELKLSKKELLIKTIQLDPSNSKAYINLADEIDSTEIITILREVDQKLVPFTKIDLYIFSIHVFAKNAIAYYNLSLNLTATYKQSVTLLNGKIMTTRQLLIKAISINNKFADAYHLLAKILDHDEQIQILIRNSTSKPPIGTLESFGKKDLLIKAIKLNPDPNYFYTLGNYFKNESIMVNCNLSEMYVKYNGIKMRPRDIFIQSFTRIPPFLLLQTIDNPFHYLNDVMAIEIDYSKRQPTIDKFLNLIDINPNNANHYFTLGYYLATKETIHLLNGFQMCKISLFVKAIELDPNHIQSYFSLYLYLHLTRDPDITFVTLSNGEIMYKEDIVRRIESMDKRLTDLMFTVSTATTSTTTTTSNNNNNTNTTTTTTTTNGITTTSTNNGSPSCSSISSTFPTS